MSKRILLAIITWFVVANIVQANERDALVALENAGATVQRDESKKDKPVVLITLNLRQVTVEGVAALAEIEDLPAIDFRGTGDTEITPATLRALQGKKSLKRFSISNAKISDEGAKVLGTLKSLDDLDLHSQIELSPHGCDEIFHLTNLKELTLSDRLVSDRSMEDLPKLSALKALNLRSIFVSDASIASIKQLKNLRTLRIFIGPEVTEAGLRRLAELPLNDLDVTWFNATDTKLKHFRKVSALKTLRLMNARAVTDEAVPFLADMTELKELEIVGSKLSKAGLKEVKNALPNCQLTQGIQ